MIKYILLDRTSSEMLSSDFAPTVSHDFHIIGALQEIDTTEDFLVVVFDGILSDIDKLLHLRMYKSVFNCKIIHIAASEATAVCEINDIAIGSIVDYEKIVLSDVEAACNLEESLFDAGTSVTADLEAPSTPLERKQLDIIEMLEKNMIYLSQECRNLRQAAIEKKTCIDVLTGQYSEMKKKYSDLRDKVELINQNARELNLINYKDIYTKVIMSKYNKAPAIIYIKEYMPLFNDYAFLEVLYQAIRMQLHKSVKVIKLMDNQAIRMAGAIPESFKDLGSKYNYNDVLVNDLLVKFGKYSDVMDILLRNQMNVSVLVVYDAKDCSDTILSGMYKGFCVCREYSQINKFRLNPANTITSTGEGDTLKWSAIDYARGMQDLIRLSSEEAIVSIMQAVEEV